MSESIQKIQDTLRTKSAIQMVLGYILVVACLVLVILIIALW